MDMSNLYWGVNQFFKVIKQMTWYERMAKWIKASVLFTQM